MSGLMDRMARNGTVTGGKASYAQQAMMQRAIEARAIAQMKAAIAAKQAAAHKVGK